MFGSTGGLGSTGVFGSTGDLGSTGVFGSTGDLGFTGILGSTGNFGSTGVFESAGSFGLSTTGPPILVGSSGFCGAGASDNLICGSFFSTDTSSGLYVTGVIGDLLFPIKSAKLMFGFSPGLSSFFAGSATKFGNIDCKLLPVIRSSFFSSVLLASFTVSLPAVLKPLS